jgi:hypothetical protein
MVWYLTLTPDRSVWWHSDGKSAEADACRLGIEMMLASGTHAYVKVIGMYSKQQAWIFTATISAVWFLLFWSRDGIMSFDRWVLIRLLLLVLSLLMTYGFFALLVLYSRARIAFPQWLLFGIALGLFLCVFVLSCYWYNTFYPNSD